METTIALAGGEDAALVAGLTKSLLEEIMAATGTRHFAFDAGAVAGHFRDFLRRGGYAAYLARQGEETVGLVTLSETRALYAGGTFGIVTELYVRPDLRSGRIGERLLESAREHGKRAGWVRLEVTTPPLPEFERSLYFYQTHGFEIAGGRKLKALLS
ncbi:MAG: GNAT family N-acetyltransferase [Sulfuricella sp.]|nr:GNAT family N-acetyltransferase [Sulfuricella sp.]